LNKDCLDLWDMDVIRFLVFILRIMSFGMSFLLSILKKINYLCIELNISRTYIMLQLKISHELADIVIIYRF
jgi:hypothetical protein